MISFLPQIQHLRLVFFERKKKLFKVLNNKHKAFAPSYIILTFSVGIKTNIRQILIYMHILTMENSH